MCGKCPDWLIDRSKFMLNKLPCVLAVVVTNILRVGCRNHNGNLLHFVSEIYISKILTLKSNINESKQHFVVMKLFRDWGVHGKGH